MTDDEIKILAMTEAMILWDRLAETGSRYKHQVLPLLHDEGKLYKNSYDGNCPLCDGLKCMLCPWPIYADDKHCLSNESPFMEWMHSRTPEGKKAAAKKVLDLLLSIEF